MSDPDVDVSEVEFDHEELRVFWDLARFHAKLNAAAPDRCPARGFQPAGQQTQQRGLAAAVGADNAEAFAAKDLEVHVLHNHPFFRRPACARDLHRRVEFIPARAG